jgi:hypothetical protein
VQHTASHNMRNSRDLLSRSNLSRADSNTITDVVGHYAFHQT